MNIREQLSKMKLGDSIVIASPEIWKMTKHEYEQKYGKPKSNTSLTGKFSPHKEAVMTALNQNKKVPENVLKDYPEFLLTKHNVKPNLEIVSIEEPGWGTWTIKDKSDKGIWTIQGKSGERVLGEGEFRFWRLADI